MSNTTGIGAAVAIAALAAVAALAALGVITGQQFLDVVYFLVGGGVATTAHAIGAKGSGGVVSGTPPTITINPRQSA